MKDGKYSNYNKRGYTTYDSLKKGKIIAILEGISKNSNSQGKE